MDAVQEHGREAIRVGSKSFAMATKLFDPERRDDARLLYAWCRHCDDEIDGQEHGHGSRRELEGGADRLEELREATERAMAGRPDDDPIFIGLARVVERHAIPPRYPRDLLTGFEMDVAGRSFRELDDSLSYCYHVAGCVGLMMARIMGAREPDTLDRANDLGIGFQMTNIARDVIADAEVGRVYLPSRWLEESGIPPPGIARPDHRRALAEVVGRWLDEADRYYDSSAWGVADLEPRCAWAIATARRVYRDIGRLVRDRGAAAWDQRAVTGRGRKIAFVGLGGLDVLTSRLRRLRRRPERGDLWTRPSDIESDPSERELDPTH